MCDIIIARRNDDTLAGLEAILREAGESFVTVEGDLADVGFADTLGDREAGVIVTRFDENDLVSLKAMQTLLNKKPGMGVIFVSSSELHHPILSLLFNEGAYGVLTEPCDPKMVVALIRKGVKRSDWKRESLAENIELKRLNTRLADQIAWFEGEGAREVDLRQKLESLVHYLLTEPGFKTKTIRILLVSGSSYQRGILTETLGKIGFTLKAVQNGEAAKKEILDFHPNIVVSDLELSDLTGVDLAKEVKGNADYPPLHFIILTSNAEKRNWILTPDTRVDDCIVKPSDAVKFKDMVARIALGILTV